MEAVYTIMMSAIVQAVIDEERFREYAQNGESDIINLAALSRIVQINQIEIPEIMFSFFHKLDLFQKTGMLAFGYQFNTFEACEKILSESKEQILVRITTKEIKITNKVISDIIYIANDWSAMVDAFIEPLKVKNKNNFFWKRLRTNYKKNGEAAGFAI